MVLARQVPVELIWLEMQFDWSAFTIYYIKPRVDMSIILNSSKYIKQLLLSTQYHKDA